MPAPWTMPWRGSMRPAFDLQLHGVGQFGNKQPHSLWAAARPNDLLDHLQRKVDTAIRRVGQPQDAHKFTPACHPGAAAPSRSGQGARMADAIMPWPPAPNLPSTRFCLYSSKLTSDGSIYRVEQEYPLRGFDGEIDD